MTEQAVLRALASAVVDSVPGSDRHRLMSAALVTYLRRKGGDWGTWPSTATQEAAFEEVTGKSLEHCLSRIAQRSRTVP